MHESNFHVTWFSYVSKTRDVVRRVSHNRVDFNMATTASSRPSMSEFQHYSPTFGPRILAIAMGTSGWRVSPVVENASVDDTNTAAAATFFVAIDDKTFVPHFNCYIGNTSQCRMTC
jgi:hypothetical protein